VAADLLRDDDALARAMIDGSAVGRAPLSPLARALMAELLDRRIGPDAKKAWLDAFGAPLAEGDPLVRDVSTRH
jgi:hypothetical protein